MGTLTPVQSAEQQIRTYGGWRLSRRGLGVGSLTSGQTLIAVGSVMTVLVLGAIHIAWLLYAAPAALVVVGISLTQWQGVPLTDVVVEHTRWWLGGRREQHTYTSGQVAQHCPGVDDLPGLLAPVKLLDAEDGQGSSYGLIWHRRSGHLTASLRVAPISTVLADRASADVWVSNWGAWLAQLGHLPIVRWVGTTVDTAPDPGSTLSDYVAGRIDPRSPQAARELMAELVAVSPAAAADVDTRVSITFDPNRAIERPDTFAEAVAEVGRALRGLENSLGSCGVTVMNKATAAQLAGTVRTAFDPDARGQVNRILAGKNRAAVLEWGDAGPIGAREFWDRYQHDSGISVSWVWQQAPRQFVTSDVLATLVAPGPFPKRVSVLYEPFPAEAAADRLEREVNVATARRLYRERIRRDETAADLADHQRAQQAAMEEAMGAGVGLTTLYVTVTVTDEKDLRRAVADIEHRAGSSKIKLRRMFRAQSTGFATTLPCGINPAHTARQR